MDFTSFTQHLIPIVLIASLILGYILKAWIRDLDNKFIPTILVVFGAIIACVVSGGISVETCVYGALSGLASTGMHQLFKQYIDNAGK